MFILRACWPTSLFHKCKGWTIMSAVEDPECRDPKLFGVISGTDTLFLGCSETLPLLREVTGL